MKETTGIRIKRIMNERNLKQIDILHMCEPYCNRYNIKMAKNDLSQYVSDKVQPKQDKLSILGMALNVSEAWLMGYDVPMERNHTSSSLEKDISYKIASLPLSPSEMDEAIDFYDKYKRLSPADQVAIQTLLKSLRPEP